MTTLRSRSVTLLALFGLLFGLVVLHGSSKPAALHPKLTAANGAWTVYHHDDGHTGYDSSQPKVVSASAGWTSTTLDQKVYAEPLVYNGIVYAATLNNTVYALDQINGSVVWSRNLGAPQSSGWTCGNVSPQGILGTPVIDTAGGRIYVAAFFSDDTYHVEGLGLTDGSIQMNTTLSISGFDWRIQQERGALALHNGLVYVPFGGRDGDCGNYHGYVVAVSTSAGATTNGPFYQTPDTGSGIWAAGGPVVDDSTGNVFAATGNGTCAVNQNDAVVRLNPTTMALQDYFMPFDYTNMCTNDVDLGSAGPLLISASLMFQSGKEGRGYLLNPANLGGVDGQLYPAANTQADVCLGTTSDATFGSFAYAAPFIYVSCQGNGLVALNLNSSAPSCVPCGSAC